jgi:hypothetical protein
MVQISVPAPSAPVLIQAPKTADPKTGGPRYPLHHQREKLGHSQRYGFELASIHLVMERVFDRRAITPAMLNTLVKIRIGIGIFA